MIDAYNWAIALNKSAIDNIAQIIPLSVAVALIVFIAREISDYVKKRRIDIRKKRALDSILLSLCQRNLYVLKKVWSASGSIENALSSKSKFAFSVKKIDRDFLDYKIDHEEGWTGGTIPPVQISQIEKILLDAAQLDQKYFEIIIEAHDSILELDHLRSSLERHVGNWNAGIDKYVLESFYNYVSDEAPLIEKALEKLGKASGGTIPLKPRVR